MWGRIRARFGHVRGRITGFCHPDAQVTIIGMKMIAYICPAVWVIEIGEVPSQVALNEIMEKK
eukprot:7150466-Lingulodinium_polyedra.AAC.1